MFLAAALAAWLAGATLGTVSPPPAAAAAPLLTISQAHVGYTPSLTGGKPVFILVIGSGARPGDDAVHSLADSIHLIALDPLQRRATVIGVPRDSFVEIPGFGTNKINAAMVDGGPALLVQTIENLMHVKVAYYALTTFWGMTDLINAIGGLTVDVPCRMVDSYSGADFRPGVQRMEGRQVLAFSRDRHSLAAGDLARSENGGRVILAALAQFRKEFAKDPSRLLTWLASGLRYIQTDIPLSQLALLAFTAYKIQPANVQNIVLPSTIGMQGSQSVVYVDASARSIFADVAGHGTVKPKHLPPSPTANGC